MKTIKALSIIGMLLFAFGFYLIYAIFQDVYKTVNALDNIGSFASLLECGNQLTDTVDSVYAIILLGFIACAYGFCSSLWIYIKAKGIKQEENDPILRLSKLNQLKESGGLTEEEYEAKKKELLY